MKKKKPTLPSKAKDIAPIAVSSQRKGAHKDSSKWKSVLGSYVGSTSDFSDTILYIATNASQIEMACIMSERSRFNSIVYSEGFDFFDYSLKHKKTSFVNSLKNVAAILKRITKVVTYIGQVNPNIRKEYRILLTCAIKLGTPVVELPHGLLQSGYNLDDNSKIIDLSSYYDGIGQSLPSIASLRLRWYGNFSVGYPRHLGIKLPERVLPSYTAITTNTNWFLYSVEDKRNFFNLVWRHAEQNPNKLFIWAPHPAETNQHTYSHSVSSLRPSNVLTYGLKQDIYFDDIENTNDLIAYSDDGISTVSTCLLEYEIYKKKVNIFSTEGVSHLIQNFSSAKTFTNIRELSMPGEVLTTGMLEKYKPEIFDEYLASAPNSDPRNAAYLELT